MLHLWFLLHSWVKKHVLWRECRMFSKTNCCLGYVLIAFFPITAHFNLTVRYRFSFSRHRYKIFMSLFLTKFVFFVLFCFYIYALAFPLLSTSAKTLKLSRIETRPCCRFFSLKVWMAKTRQASAQSKKKKKTHWHSVAQPGERTCMVTWKNSQMHV